MFHVSTSESLKFSKFELIYFFLWQFFARQVFPNKFSSLETFVREVFKCPEETQTKVIIPLRHNLRLEINSHEVHKITSNTITFRERLQIVDELIRDNLQFANEKIKVQYDIGALENSFEAGDIV